MYNKLQLVRNQLAKRYNIKHPTELYRKIINYPDTLSQLPSLQSEELINHIIYLGTNPERRNQGVKSKEVSLLYLREYKKRIIKADFITNSQILLSLSNVLLYDQTLINEIVTQVEQQKNNIQIQDMIQLHHCLYKLNINNAPLTNFILEQISLHKVNLNFEDYLHYTHILSVLYKNGQINEQTMKDYIENIPARKFKFYNSKFCFQYCQLMYNLIPELTNQNDYNKLNQQNPFVKYFEMLQKDYQISKKMVSLKSFKNNVEYWEMDRCWIRIKDELSERKLTKLESEVQQILNRLNQKNKRAERVLIYDVDYLVNDKIIINCNESVHFIEDFDGKIIYINPNQIMQSRHLNEIGKYVVREIDYYEWESLTEQQKQQKIESLIV